MISVPTMPAKANISARHLATLAAFLSSIALLNTACVSRGRSIAVRMNIVVYSKSILGGVSGNVHLEFPTLELYDGAGFLLYRGVDENKNLEMLESLPQNLPTMKRIGSTSTLRASLEKVPEFKARMPRVAGRRRYFLVSIGLTGCGSCAIQDKAIARLRQRVRRTRLDMLTLDLQQ